MTPDYFTRDKTATPYPIDPNSTAIPIEAYPYELPDEVILNEVIVRGGKKGSKKKRKAQNAAKVDAKVSKANDEFIDNLIADKKKEAMGKLSIEDLEKLKS